MFQIIYAIFELYLQTNKNKKELGVNKDETHQSTARIIVLYHVENGLKVILHLDFCQWQRQQFRLNYQIPQREVCAHLLLGFTPAFQASPKCGADRQLKFNYLFYRSILINF